MGLRVMRFSAVWCLPCRQLDTYWSNLVKDYPNIEFSEFDIDEHPAQASLYHIASIPTILFLKDGQVVESLVGLRKESVVRAAIEKWKV